MEFLREVYERRKKYFEQLEKYLEDIKEIVKKDAPDAEIYLYGSVAEGNFSIGLSDIDVAIVSDRFKDREKKLETFGKLTKEFFDSPFEFHVLTRKQWETHKKFIKNAKKV
uniref:Nucleotidyltransferase domain-containing protein n=1 Tax=Geoglobus ahangari TaxID=113653 RepID=A0A7C4WD82_9EURY